MSKLDSLPPYSLFEGNTGGFLTVEFPQNRIALPYLALRRIELHGESERIVLEFAEQNIEVHGRGLNQLFEFLAAVRVKTLRVGCEEKGCRIEKLIALDG